MTSKIMKQQVLICFYIAGIVAQEVTKFWKFPGFNCHTVSGEAVKGLSVTRCIIKGLMKKCSDIQTSPACQCCETVTTADNSTALYSRACPGGGALNLVTRKCYYVRKQVKRWIEARDACRAEGFELVKIENAAENAFVFGLLSNTTWIGLNDLETEGTYRWSDGSQNEYRNWYPGEPNDQSGQQDCVDMNWPGRGAKWDDYQCQNPLPEYVCTLKINP